MIRVHTAIRPFMRPGEDEPNVHYRPWLEKNVGKQDIHWSWNIHSVKDNSLCISFKDSEKSLLFELTWP